MADGLSLRIPRRSRVHIFLITIMMWLWWMPMNFYRSAWSNYGQVAGIIGDRPSGWWSSSGPGGTIATGPPIRELCGDCRLNPSAAGRPVTCLDRAVYLQDRYGLTEEQSRSSVMEANGAHCNMTRYPVELWSPDAKWDDSVAGVSAGANGEDAGRGFDSIFGPDGSLSNAGVSARPVGGGGNLSIYFYESMPDELGIGLERNMTSQYATGAEAEENFKADLVILHLFRTHPGRVRDPTEADLFVVPYPHAAHCLRHPGWSIECGHVPGNVIQEGVLDNLAYYEGNEARHLFVNTHEIFHTHKMLNRRPLFLTLGPRLAGATGQIVVPYLNDRVAFQPSAIRRRPEGWWVRPRRYSLAYFYGSTTNKRMQGKSPRYYRTYFVEEVQRRWNTTRHLGGLPYVVQKMSRLNVSFADGEGGRRFLAETYGASTFCLVLPGDSPPQKRFFDAIMCGCIPVVLSFDATTAGRSGRSWWTPGGHPIEDAYPWARGSNGTYPPLEIDYASFVLEVHGGVGNVRSTIEGAMRNGTDVRRRQLQLMRYAPAFAYGVGSEAHASADDAFARIVESLRYYLAGMKGS